jgi:hypothetical protein
MAGVDLIIRECDGQFVVALRGELDMADAASVPAALAAVAARTDRIGEPLASADHGPVRLLPSPSAASYRSQ